MHTFARRGLRVLATAGLAVPTALIFAGTAHAESAPGCAQTVQIGATAYINVGSGTAASVKQFKGCGRNYAYVFVWDQYRRSHSSYACASVVTRDNTLRDLNCANGEVWSRGADTLSACTRALGYLPDVAQQETEERC